MDSSNNDNVVSMAEFRLKKQSPKSKQKMTKHMESFVEHYHEAGPEAIDTLHKVLMILNAYGFETEDFDRKDVLLLREAIFSIILRYREAHHPLHTFVEDFDKYFSRIEYFLDTEWQDADEDPDNEGPETA